MNEEKFRVLKIVDVLVQPNPPSVIDESLGRPLLTKRIAILTTHPIQYQAPWFRALASRSEIDLEVLFCHQATPREQAGAGFGVEFDWDTPVLDGYPYRFLNNVAKKPAVSGYFGMDTPDVKKVIEREKYDAVIINGWHYKSAWQAIRACWQTKTPVMARSDSHLHTERSLAKRAAKRPFYRWFIPKLDACLAVGKWSRDYFLHYGARPESVFMVPHVIDDRYFCRESARRLAQRNQLRAHWGIDRDAATFLFAGKFIEKKRPMDFIRAVKRASRASSRVAGLMVGDGPLRTTCEEFTKANKLPISFAGFLNQSEIAKAYVAADALVLPSVNETWALVVNEAMACGRPCFVSDQVGCAPDLIVQDETGAIFPMGNHEVLANLLAAHAMNPGKLNLMGELARKKAQEFEVDVAIEGTLQALETVS